MAISFVAHDVYENAGVGDSQIRATMPTGIQVGDLLLVGYGNVSNEGGLACTPASGWTTVQESLAGTNCYFVMLAKIATSTETAAAGTDIQVATYGNGTTGQTNRTSVCMAFRGTETTVGAAVIDSNMVHETAPADETINTGSVTATASTQWYAFFYNMASGGNQSTATFSTDAGTLLSPQAVHNNSTSTTSGVAGGHSNGTISVASHSRNGTWSSNSSRLNAGIVVIEAAAAASTDANAESASATVTANQPSITSSGNKQAPAEATDDVTATALAPSITVSGTGSTNANANTGVVTAVANSPTVTITGDDRLASAGHASASAEAFGVATEEVYPLADYEIFVDWDNDGGLLFGDFELSTDGWTTTTTSGTAPTIATSATRAHAGDRSLLISWASSTSPRVRKVATGLTSGKTYKCRMWSYTPSASGMNVRIGVVGGTSTTTNTTDDQWVEHTLTFTASSSSHTIEIIPASNPTGSVSTWVDQVILYQQEEDVTADCLGLRTPLDFKYGRDTARSLSAIAPGDVSFELNNLDRTYSPDNTSSPLNGMLAPGRPVLIRATFNGKTYNMFRGFLDEYKITPEVAKRSVELSAMDIIGKYAETQVFTELHRSLQTGEALHVVLDAIGWPEDRRDIDSGASTLHWWWVNGENMIDTVKTICAAEGPTSFAFVDASGNFVFRDRHHRFLRANSITSQATFRDQGTEPTFCAPFEYDIGWRDLVNSVVFEVEERGLQETQVVFEQDDLFTLGTGESYTIPVQPSDPFIDAITPVAGTDYIVQQGDVSVTLTKTSGQQTDIVFTANSPSYISNVKLRARPVPVARTLSIKVENQTSIDKHGVRSWTEDVPSFINRHDAAAVAQMIVSLRAERLPVVSFTVNSGNATRLTEIMRRRLSDRITIVETETNTNHDFFIETITHNVEQVGYDHRAVFGCERVRTQEENLFTFGEAGKGFNQGFFGLSGLDDSDSIFILDSNSPGHRLNEGRLAT